MIGRTIPGRNIQKRPLNSVKLCIWVLSHEFFCLLRFVGLRDRLRCPICKKVGTWKPHRPPRRWLCKWCGYYEDSGRTGLARPCKKKRVWMLKPIKRGLTPAERIRKVDPWRG